MVDLPRVQERNITSEMATSAVTPGVIEKQAAQQAGAVSSVADTLMDYSIEAAKKQASDDLIQQKVTRDADGNVQVLNPANSLFFGRAGETYENAVRVGTVAQHSNVVSTTLTELHQQFPADPHGFKAASDAFREKYVPTHGGVMGEAVIRDFDQQSTQHQNAITNAAGQADVAKQGSEISAAQTRSRDDVFAALRGGASLEDPAIKDKIAEWDATTTRRQANPLFGYSAAQAQLDRDSFHSEAGASRFLFDVKQTYDSKDAGGGYAGAVAKAQSILTDPRYELSQPLREQYAHRALAEIRTLEALRKQDVAEARAGLRDLSMRSATSGAISSDEVEQLAKQFRDAGDPGGAASVYSMFARKPLNDAFGKQSLPEMTAQIGALTGVHAAEYVRRAFIAKGYTPEQAAGIVGNTIHESGVNPSAVGDGGTSAGIAQFHNERLTALKQFAANRGKPATDLQTQVDFIDYELNTSETKTRDKLRAARTPEEAAAAFIDYERPAGWTPSNSAGGLGYESRQRHARMAHDGTLSDASMGSTPGRAWLIQNRSTTLNDAATTQWSTVMKDFKAEGTMPSPTLVNNVIDAARVTNNTALLDTIAADTRRMDFVRLGAQAALPDQDATITSLKAAGTQGNLSPGDASVLKDFERRRDAIVKGLENNPISTAVSSFSDSIKSPGPLNLSDPAAFAQGLRDRSKIAQFAADRWKTTQLSVLDQEDVRQIRAGLQGDQGAGVLVAVAGALKPDEIAKVFEDKGLRDSVVGMQSNSVDTSKMVAANSFADMMWRHDPALAESVLGSKSMDKLHAWQGLKDTFSADEVAKMLNRADDPALAQARKDAVKAADEETIKITPSDMAYKLGSGSWLLRRLTGNTPDVPYDSMQGAALVGEFRTGFRELRATGLSQEKAEEQMVERMRSTWGASAAAGNRLMKNPPEMSPLYPSIDGSKDWIKSSLKDWITMQRGPEFSTQRRSLEAGVALAGGDPNWTIEGLISDQRTQTDIAAGRRPSYQVVIKNRGMLDFIEGRVDFDPASFIAKHEAMMRTTVEHARVNRWAHAGDRPAYLFGEALPQ